MTSPAELQRAYYERTAADYDAAHRAEANEHDIALAAFRGIVDPLAPKSILDVGAGTGPAYCTMSPSRVARSPKWSGWPSAAL